jgi:diadenosine tetraphosphate (Ap4A) HIT family hydrolase
MTRSQWPSNWGQLIRGIGCEMCESAAELGSGGAYGELIRATDNTVAVLQRADIQRGYTLVIWRGRHVNEPTELTDEEAAAYWLDVLSVARVLIRHYQPLKMNYETLGNSLPHLHTHLVPRYAQDDPAPGRPFPLMPQNGSEPRIDSHRLLAEASALRSLLNLNDNGE